MIKPLFPYKHGDVQSGNWQWAVGAKANVGERPLCVATINFHGANAAGYDCESLAAKIAEKVSPPEQTKALRCPDCGDTEHLYWLHASVRWDPETRTWNEPLNDDGELECTECDYHGPEEEFEQAGEAEELRLADDKHAAQMADLEPEDVRPPDTSAAP